MWINIDMQLDMSQAIDPKIVGRWESNKFWSEIGAITFGVLGVIALALEGIKVWRIMGIMHLTEQVRHV